MPAAQERSQRETEELFVPRTAILHAARMLTATERLLTLRLEDGRPLGHAPGQFVQVSIFGMAEAPISVCSAGASGRAEFQLCVRRMGRLTSALHELEVGETVGIRGPLGRGFPLDALAGRDVVFIAGGIGLAPMRSLIQWSLAHRDRVGHLTLLHGAKRPAELLFGEEFPQWRKAKDFDLQLIVDEGDASWTGPVGLITELIAPLSLAVERTAAVVVGPPVMYRFAIEELEARHIPPSRIVLSLERHMRCGVGTCGHCMIGELYCCRDGPVFTLSDLEGVEGAF
jgi:NAD(P)H-flavin reductase